MTEDGDYVLDTQSRRIRVDTLQDAKIADDGTITQNDVAVARIGLVDFEDYDYLEKYGETYYRPVEGANAGYRPDQVGVSGDVQCAGGVGDGEPDRHHESL